MSWDAKKLLNPKAASDTPSGMQPAGTAVGPATATPAANGLSSSTPIMFQFATPDDNTTVDFSGLPHPTQSGRQHNPPTMPVFQNGFSHHIERLNNVQERIMVPQPKRRKTQSEDDPTPAKNEAMFRSASSSILSEYVKKQPIDHSIYTQKQPTNGTSTLNTSLSMRSLTVDLTDADSSQSQKSKGPAKDPGDEEVCYGMVEGAMINAHKVPAPKPGMISIGGDGYWPQVKVMVRRLAGEATTRIQVYDYTRTVFGNLDSKTAGCLAPLLDANFQIRTDCRIPMRRKEPGEKVGQTTSRPYKFELMVYGPRKFVPGIGRHFIKNNMNLLSPPRVEPGVQVVNPLARENRAPPPSRYPGLGDGVTHSYPASTVRTVEEIRSEVMNVFDSLTKSEDLPEMDPSECVQTELLRHQRQALYFMTSRETDRIPDAGDTVVSSTWQRRRDPHGQEIYYNVITNQSQRERPQPALGGILADMMGLGKTLSILSLLTNSLSDAADWSRLPPVQPVEPPKKPSHASRNFELPRAQNFPLTQLRYNGKATLLICPLSTVTNWEEQLKQHIKPNSISYHVYHGPNRLKDAAQLAKFDLVITTYGSVSSELNGRVKKKPGIYPLEEIAWFRVVLDEAHMIREQNTLTFKSICRLQASRRWAVTGTPVQNKLEDLASLLAFLRLKPFDEKSKFFQHIIQPFKSADPEIVPKLRVLIDTVTLRRLKDKINLPPNDSKIIKLRFSDEERRIYDWFAKTAQEKVQVLTGQNSGQDRIFGGRTMIHILRSILQLRLICAHGKDLLNDDDLADLQGMTAEMAIDLDSDDDEDQNVLQEKKAYDMLYLMQEGNNDNCFQCDHKLGANDVIDIDAERQEDVLGYMAACFHVYCPTCMDKIHKKALRNEGSDNRCPTCAGDDMSAFVELRKARANLEHESRSAKSSNVKGTGKERYGGPHTKTRALVEDLLANKAQSATLPPGEPPFKSVVFSGWTSHLDLIQYALDDVGITYTRLDGKMTRPARNAAMDAFRDDPSVQVILVSIMAGGLGLNLTSANSVYVMEPQFNPAAEAQAIDRVHRLGQKRPVKTVRYIMENSFEEKMLLLQEKKKKLANLSLDGRDKEKVMDRTDAARQRLLDLRSLFK